MELYEYVKWLPIDIWLNQWYRVAQLIEKCGVMFVIVGYYSKYENVQYSKIVLLTTGKCSSFYLGPENSDSPLKTEEHDLILLYIRITYLRFYSETVTG